MWLDEPLPQDLQAALGEFFGSGRVETLDEWADEIRAKISEDSLSLDSLCHADGRTGHYGEMDGERYDFQCFYDVVIMAAVVGEPVDITSESPDGTVIEAHSTDGTDLSVTPDDAVFSFGINPDVAADKEEVTLEDGYAAICPYVKAFSGREAYEEWAASVGVPTVAMPLDGATELATALAV